MGTRRALAVSVCSVVLMVALIAAAFRPLGGLAYACSIGGTDYAAGALREVANTRILLVGTVVSEQSMPRPPNTSPAWESVVQPHVVIKGELPDGPLLVPYIGLLGGDCSGGPRLREGETVMIPVFRGPLTYGSGEEGWRLHGIFSKVLLQDGQATLEWADGSQPLGDAEAVIREYGQAVGADGERIEAAIAFVNSHQEGGHKSWLDPWLYIGGVAIAVAVVALGWALRRRLAR